MTEKEWIELTSKMLDKAKLKLINNKKLVKRYFPLMSPSEGERDVYSYSSPDISIDLEGGTCNSRKDVNYYMDIKYSADPNTRYTLSITTNSNDGSIKIHALLRSINPDGSPISDWINEPINNSIANNLLNQFTDCISELNKHFRFSLTTKGNFTK